MTGAMRQVVAFGGGGFSQESGNPLLDDYVLGLTGTADPRVCFLPTASGDAVNRVPGLGFLRHSNAVHYGEGARRGAFHRHLLDGMPAGFAAEDGAALRFVGDELVEVVASRPEARAYKLEQRGSQVLETRL